MSNRKKKAPKKTKVKYFYHWEGVTQSHSKEALAQMKAKAKRRAKRHFEGKVVKHRVVSKDDSQITFAFRRRSNRVTIRYRRQVMP